MGVKDDRAAAIRKAAMDRLTKRGAEKSRVKHMAREQYKTKRSLGTSGRGARMEDVSREDVIEAVIEAFFNDKK